jgi:hypothetical protein
MGPKDKEPSGSDRRRDARHDRSLPLRVAHDSAEGLRAESINVSTRGLYCKVQRYVQPFSKLKVALDLPFVSQGQATVECEGVVVRVDPEMETPGAKEYHLAIYFLDLDRKDASLIETFLTEAH